MGKPLLSRRRKMVYAAIAVVGLVVAAEIGVRVVCWLVGEVPHALTTDWCRAHDDLLHVYKPGYEGKIHQNTVRIGKQGLRSGDFPTRKPDGTYRVLCLGDSRTFGFVVGETEPYPAQLERLLRTRDPNRRIEVLNAGLHGYSSYQGLRYLELRGLEYEPDLVTVAFGFNDRRFVPAAEQADGPEWFRKAARTLRWRSRTRISYALLSLGKVSRRVWPDVPTLPTNRIDRLPCRVAPEAFKKNLRAIADVCRRRRIPVVFLIMADAARAERGFAEGHRLRAAKQYDEARVAFGRIGREPPNPATEQWFRALVLYETALTHEAEGRTSEAAAAFRESVRAASIESILGGTPIRHARQYVAIMREVAEALDLPQVDVAGQFAERPELFVDFCHYTAEGHRLIAETLADCIVERKLLEAPAEKAADAPEP